MAINKPMEIAFGDIKHIIIDIVFVEYHCVLFHIWVSECPKKQIKLPAIFAFDVHAKRILSFEYRGDYSAAFCVFGSLSFTLITITLSKCIHYRRLLV